MQRKIIMTNDGSHSIEVEGTGETYHSRFGAIQESLHVFINAGLMPLLKASETINIFEMGFGSGLNALLTLIEAEKNQQKICYECVELFPVEKESIVLLNYCAQLQRNDLKKIFESLHTCEWKKEILISPYFSFQKNNSSLVDYMPLHEFNLIFYDAFAPGTQPELWTKEIFQKLLGILSKNGILVTYCSKGEVQRNLRSAGFAIEKLPGAKGKREMIRAIKKDKKEITLG